jgi:hypothetical protein
VIAQDGQSSKCAEEYFNIDPDTCACHSVGCPTSSRGNDPQVNEFGTNSASSLDENGNYVYIDEYWHYIQQIRPNGTQVNSPDAMVTHQCFSDDPKKGVLYTVTSLQYDHSQQKLYGLVNVPNDNTGTYDGKIVTLDPNTGECIDVVDNIVGSPVRWPYTCCGEASGPAFDQATGTYYAYGANGYSPKISAYTLISVDIPKQTYAVGFLPSSIYIAQGFMFHDSVKGLHALGFVQNKFGIYRLQPWTHLGDISAELIVDKISTRGPSGWAYNEKTKKLHLVFDDYSFPSSKVVTVDMETLTVSSCTLPKECGGKIWLV